MTWNASIFSTALPFMKGRQTLKRGILLSIHIDNDTDICIYELLFTLQMVGLINTSGKNLADNLEEIARNDETLDPKV